MFSKRPAPPPQQSAGSPPGRQPTANLNDFVSGGDSGKPTTADPAKQKRCLAILDKAARQQASDEDLTEAFGVLDADGDGAISRKEWMLIFGDNDIFDVIPKRNPQNLQKNDWMGIKAEEVAHNVFVKLHPELLDHQPTDNSDMAKLERKNALLDVMGTEGQQVIVTGDTSVGKSTIINFILGFPVNFEATGVGTRRPSIISLTKDMAAEDPQFDVKFVKPDRYGRPSFDEKGVSADRVAEISGECNSVDKNPQFFEEGKQFDSEPLMIKIRHKQIKYALRLVDLPGMTRRNPEPMAITKSFIKPGNICVLVIGRDNAANAEWPTLASEMAKCKKVLCLQNFGSMVLRDAGTVKDNVKVLEDKILKSHPDFALTVVDFGLPRTDDNVKAGSWKGPSGDYPGDQADWMELLKKRQPTQTAMSTQAEKWSQYLTSKFGSQINPGQRTQAGLSQVHKDLLAFMIDGIDDDIKSMQGRVREKIAAAETRLEAAQAKVKNITSQKIWHKLLAFYSKAMERYFDTTQECESTLMNTTEEVEHAGNEYWFNKEMDSQILKFSSDSGLLPESDCKLACLASWFRLLDELSVMLAFSPMKCLTKSRKNNAFDRTDSGTGGKINTFDCMVELLIDEQSALFENSEKKPKAPIIGLLRVFQKRIMALMNRDIERGFKAVQDSVRGKEHLSEFSKDSGLGKDEMCQLQSALMKSILEYADRTVNRFINGEKEEDGSTTLKSGICVPTRPQDAACPGPLHWLQPFPLHYFNGQLPWKLLKIDEDAAKKLAEAVGVQHDPVEDDTVSFSGPTDVCGNPIPDDKLVEAIQDESMERACINASNSINYKLAVLSIQREIFHVDKDSQLMVYDMYSMKTLKAMQGEIMTFWKGASRIMVQELFDKDRAWNFLQERIPESAEGQDNLQKAVEQIMSILKRSDFQDDKSVEEEIAVDPDKFEWPGLPLQEYMQMLTTIVKTNEESDDYDESSSFSFPANKDEKMAGQRSWTRLAEEFAHVVFQLASRNVTMEEARMAAASSGDAVDAGPMEIVTKLILHRMSAIGGKVTEIFEARLKALYDRDVGLAIEKFKVNQMSLGKDAVTPPEFVNGVEWDRFLQMHLVCPDADVKPDRDEGLDEETSYMAKVMKEVLETLDRHLEELTPIDPVVLNGRLPLAQLPLRVPSFDMTVNNKGKPVFKQVADDKAKGDILKVSQQAFLGCWDDEDDNFKMSDFMKIELDQAASEAAKAQKTGGKDKNGGKGGVFANRVFLKLDAKTSEVAYKSIATSNATSSTIEMWANNIKTEEAPYKFDAQPLAGNSLHFMLLRLHKSMHAAAIDYCRPRLRAMMSYVYQSDKLLDAFHEIDFASKFVEKAKDNAESEQREAMARLQALKDALAASER